MKERMVYRSALGIDVSGERLDWHRLPEEARGSHPNTVAGIAALQNGERVDRRLGLVHVERAIGEIHRAQAQTGGHASERQKDLDPGQPGNGHARRLARALQRRPARWRDPRGYTARPIGP